MPININKLGTSAAASIADKFVSELSFALRNAFNEFLDDMYRAEIQKNDPRFEAEYKKRMPLRLNETLKALYYKYTVGKYQYLNSLPFETFINLIKSEVMKGLAADFYNSLKTTTLGLAKVIQTHLKPGEKKESMTENIKVKVLVDKLLAEARLSKRIVKEEEEGEEDTNPEDVVKMDVPFLIRAMEFAKEDAKSDLDLHSATEKMIKRSKTGEVLKMDDYDSIFAQANEVPKQIEEEGDETESEDDNTILTEYKTTADDSPRPSRMARPDIQGMTKNAKAYWDHLYIQDEAEDILQDKYGNAKGSQYFQGLLNAPKFGGFYQAVTQIVMEKFKMYTDLGEQPPRNYFDESWFSVWKRWMAAKGKPYTAKEEPKVTPKKEPKKPLSAIVNDKSIPSIKDLPKQKPAPTGYDAKDEKRIQDIMTYSKGSMSKALQLAQVMANKITDYDKCIRRANAAEADNYHNIANVFYKRALQLRK